MDNIEVKNVWVVIPAYNEEEIIRSVVDSLQDYNVVVVDDCSKDETSWRLDGTHAHVLRHIVNLGQGAALQTGITYALHHGAEYVVTFDADGQHQPDDIPYLLAPLVVEDYDVTLGTRFSETGEAVNIPPMKRRLL